MQRVRGKKKKTKSVCNFIGLKSHKLNYECKKCKKRWKTLLMKIIHMLKKIFEELKLKNLGDYHDLYVQSDTLLLADVFENFRNKCIEIYELDPAHFLSAPGLAWQACLKKTEGELELLTNNMLLMVEKGTRGRICQVLHRYAKANTKYMKNYDKNTTSSYLTYLNANNLYGWVMS